MKIPFGSRRSQSMIKFYDNTGHLVLVQEGDFLFTTDGNPYAQVSNGVIYLIKSKKHIGWLKDNWIFDTKPSYRFFTTDSKGGPVRPPILPSFVYPLKPVVPNVYTPVSVMGVPHLEWSKQQKL